VIKYDVSLMECGVSCSSVSRYGNLLMLVQYRAETDSYIIEVRLDRRYVRFDSRLYGVRWFKERERFIADSDMLIVHAILTLLNERRFTFTHQEIADVAIGMIDAFDNLFFGERGDAEN
jgi:hypothetical protein